MRRGWYGGHSGDRTRIVPNLEVERRWETWTLFQKNLWLWAETNGWILDFTSCMPNRTLMVHSEDVFAADAEILQRLFDFINAPVPPKYKVSRVLGKKLNAQKSGSFPKSLNWNEAMCGELLEICGETAERLGYRFD
jgi:hypothetical protein